MYILTPDHQITQLHGNSEVECELKVQDNTSFYKNFQETWGKLELWSVPSEE